MDLFKTTIHQIWMSKLKRVDKQCLKDIRVILNEFCKLMDQQKIKASLAQCLELGSVLNKYV
jgi:hypothetical protein